MFWTSQALDSGSAGYMVTAGGNSLCFILLAVNGSWDDNGGTKALIIFLCLQERYCFFSQFIEWVGEGCVCVWVCDRVKRQKCRAGLRDVCVCVRERERERERLVGVMGGPGTCIIDPPLGASCTRGGIKMIHGLFPGLIPVILRYQTAVFCSWQRGAHTHASRAYTHKTGGEFFHRGWGDNLIGTFVFVSCSFLAPRLLFPLRAQKQKLSSRGPAAAAASVAYK